jgi:EF hand
MSEHPKAGSGFIIWGIAGVAVVAALVTAWRLSASPPPQESGVTAKMDVEFLPRLSNSAQAALPAPAEKIELTTEQRRMKRYDKNTDGMVDAEEYLASRRKAYAKLDKDGDGKLSFDEYAVKTIDKFGAADSSGDKKLSPAEFALTSAKRKITAVVECPPDREG